MKRRKWDNSENEKLTGDIKTFLFNNFYEKIDEHLARYINIKYRKNENFVYQDYFLQNWKYFELNVEIVCEIGKQQRPVQNTVVSI